MSEDRRLDYVDHMPVAAQLACDYVAGLDKDEFLADKRTQQAVIMNIVIIGEAASKLANDYPAFIAQYPDMPWRNMRGMRNRIAQGYFDINLDTVWDTVQLALPKLVSQLTAVRHSIMANDGQEAEF